MNAQERVRGIRHGIEQAAHEVGPFRGEAVILAAEGDDRRARVVAGKARHAVGLQAGADDKVVELEHVAVHLDLGPAARSPDPGHLGAEVNLAVGGTHILCQRVGDGAVVGDPGRARMQSRDPSRVRLELTQLLPFHPADAGYPVRLGSAAQLAQRARSG